MSLVQLLPVLEAVYERDQLQLKAVQDRRAEFLAQIASLSSPLENEKDATRDIELLRRAEKHSAWKSMEIARLTRKIEALEPELSSAMTALKASFGKLEAARSVVREGS